MWVDTQRHRQARFTPGNKTRYLLYRRLGGLQSLYGETRNIPPSTGIDPRPSRPKRVAILTTLFRNL